MQVVNQLALRNRILGALPNEEYGRIAPHLSQVTFEKDDVIYRSEDPIDFVYLPESGLISLLSTTETGSTIEVAMLGKEGLVGLPVVLKNHIIPYEVKVRFSTEALRIKAEIFQEEFDKGQVLHDFVLRYLNVMLTQISQSSICNRFHTIEATLSRWLLSVQDQTSSNTLDLTQKVISEALGVPRTGVTVAAGALQTAGAIRYSRGKILILDRVRLESRTCECYRTIRDELDHFLNE